MEQRLIVLSIRSPWHQLTSDLETSTILAPSAASAVAQASPMPIEAPVRSTTLPCRDMLFDFRFSDMFRSHFQVYTVSLSSAVSWPCLKSVELQLKSVLGRFHMQFIDFNDDVEDVTSAQAGLLIINHRSWLRNLILRAVAGHSRRTEQLTSVRYSGVFSGRSCLHCHFSKKV